MNYYDTYKRVLFVCSGLIPSAKLGVVKPLLALQKNKKLKFHIVHEKNYYAGLSIKYDAVVMCRAVSKVAYEIALDIVKSGSKLIYELDDNFFSIPTETVIGRWHRHPINIFYHIKIMQLASCVRVYSDLLYERVSKYNANVMRVNAYFDAELINSKGNVSYPSSNMLRILYATSRNDDYLKSIFEPAIIKVLSERDNVELHIWGANENKISHPRIKYYEFESSYELYIKKIMSLDYTIALAPMINDDFYNSKTNNKYREYGGMRIAGVYSNVPLYSSCVKNEITGLLVNNDEAEWVSAISKLLDNKCLRDFIIDNASCDVKDNYSFAAYLDVWERVVFDVKNKTSPLVKSKKNSVIVDLRERKSSSILLSVLSDYVTYSASSLVELNKYLMCGVKNVVVIGDEDDVEFIASLIFSAGCKILGFIVGENIDYQLEKQTDTVKLFSLSKLDEQSKSDFKLYNSVENNSILEFLNTMDDFFVSCDVSCNFGFLYKMKEKCNYIYRASCWLFDLMKINFFGFNR